MKKTNSKKTTILLMALFSVALLLIYCSKEEAVEEGVKNETAKKETVVMTTSENNPFFSEFNTPFGVPPFDSIKQEHYLPAIKKGIEKAKEEIAVITANLEPATFENSIEALEYSGKFLTRVTDVFFSLNGSNTNAMMQKIAQEATPLLSKHRDDINLDEKLFARIKAVYQKKDQLKLNLEQAKLLKEFYQGFVRNGAQLSNIDKEKLREINKKLSLLSLKFRENVLSDTNRFQMFLTNQKDLAGLPESIIMGSSQAAKAAGKEGQWLFTLHKPSWIPFLTYSTNRELREKLYKGYINVGDNNNENDNKKIIAQIAALRVKKANLLGYKTHADFKLEKNMAKEPKNVYKLLKQLWQPALEMAKGEAEALQSLIDKENGNFKLESWDWWYYAEKLRKEKYDLSDETLRPYFKLENVRNGAFYVANKLYGIKFIERTDIPKYHEEVKTFEVLDVDGSQLGIYYVDYFPRVSKRGGAWCGSFREQYYSRAGKKVNPIVTNVMNFSKPLGDKPALLSFDEALTLFHEFGHALHGLFSNCRYATLGGFAVAWDFVELPAQIMEHWAGEPEDLKVYAKHYQTGEAIPKELLDKLQKSSLFNQGFATTEYLAACLLDMNWHTLTNAEEIDTNKFEREYLDKIGLIPEIISRYRSTYFRHIVGGYDAGYYAYIWAEVLDCDAFEAFKETSLFDQKTAQAFRKNVLERGGTEDPMDLYVRFRGKEPKIDALLKKRGFK